MPKTSCRRSLHAYGGQTVSIPRGFVTAESLMPFSYPLRDVNSECEKNYVNAWGLKTGKIIRRSQSFP